jgi:uroporphyrinogen decarboxylase
MAGGYAGLRPAFPREVVTVQPDGSRHVRNGDGVIVVERDAAGSIQAEVEHLLVDRRSWEEHYLPRMAYLPDSTYR